MFAAAQRRLRELDPGVSRETLGGWKPWSRFCSAGRKPLIWLAGRPGRRFDPLSWIPHLALIPKDARIWRFGSGAGFPAGLGRLRPELDVTLIEADARKSAYLGEAARKMACRTAQWSSAG
jgi:hypothetical protein